MVFPLTLQPLAVNRPVSVDSVNRALGGDRLVLLVQQAGDVDDPGPGRDPRRSAPSASSARWRRARRRIQIVVEGLVRARITDVARAGNAAGRRGRGASRRRDARASRWTRTSSACAS
ncbi:MAG: LON peptidase substrate-binding domain-containing protein [Ignavibacteriales bacterium]|nr:LON peptidase substrate-binding domain-containing protein [Ignavibacteriales bacterium]